jgi:hypothetical protein
MRDDERTLSKPSRTAELRPLPSARRRLWMRTSKPSRASSLTMRSVSGVPTLSSSTSSRSTWRGPGTGWVREEGTSAPGCGAQKGGRATPERRGEPPHHARKVPLTSRFAARVALNSRSHSGRTFSVSLYVGTTTESCNRVELDAPALREDMGTVPAALHAVFLPQVLAPPSQVVSLAGCLRLFSLLAAAKPREKTGRVAPDKVGLQRGRGACQQGAVWRGTCGT